MSTETEKDIDSAERRIYEVGYLAVPVVPEEKVPALIGDLKSAMADKGAAVISEDYPKMRELAYEMRKARAGKYHNFSDAYFGWVKFEAAPEEARAIDNLFKENADILRHITIRTVREDTRAAAKGAGKPVEGRPKKREKPKTADKKPVISDEELDKTIEELVVE